MLRPTVVVLVTSLIPAFALAQVPPEKAVETMTVADGLQIELFASEPMVINPTSIDVDHLGRVWVCEAVNYRRVNYGRPIIRPEGDRIIILEDTKGVGKADKSTVFYQGKEIYGPMGVAVAPIPGGKPGACKVYVCQSPDILLFEDLDGDGKADGPPKKLLTNIGGFDHDHGVHGINIGPDGKLYFTVGDQGVKGLQSSDGKGRKWFSNDTDCRAGTVWRCDMDGKNLELIAHNFRNNYECCVNSFGEIWLSDNDDDGNQQTRICYVMPGGDYGYYPRGPGQSHWHEEQPGIVHKVLRTGFGSPTGICFYEGTLLPKKYQGQLLHCDAGPREFRCFHIKPKGAGYELEKELLVTSKDTWFRLSDVCVAPDGSVMLADWYDPGVGGHGMGDWTRGRIFRVTPKGHVGYKVPKVDLESDGGIFGALVSPCLATRALAINKLHEIDALDALQLLSDGMKQARDSTFLTRALWHFAAILHRIPKEKRPEAGDRRYWQETMRLDFVRGSNAPLAQAYSVRLSRVAAEASFAEKPFDEDFFAQDRGRAEKTAAHREMLIELRLANAEKAAPWFYALAKFYDGEDRFYLAALNIACGTDPKRRDAILADFDKHFPEWNDKVADLVWELRPKSVLPRLEKLLSDGKLTAAQKGRIVDILAVNDDPAAGKAMLKLVTSDAAPEVKARAIENLRLFLPTKWKDLKHGEDVGNAITGLLKTADSKLVGLQLAAAAPDCTKVSEIEALAKDAGAAREIRTEAVRVIGMVHHVKYFHMLEPLIADPVVGPSVVTALGGFVGERGDNSGAKQAMQTLQTLVLNTSASAELKQAAISALTGTQLGSAWLLKLKEEGKMPESVVADGGRLLRNSPFQPIRNKAMLLFPPPGKLDIKKLPSIAVLAKRQGNVEKGRLILSASLKNEAQCLKCHTVRGSGGQVGPDLSMIGKKASRENLIESILYPSKAIADQYIQWRIETKKGQDIMGLIIEETPTEILLRDANAKDYKIAKADIDSRTKSPVSIMPENIAASLTEDELIDVAEYLLTLKTASLTPDFWNIVGPFSNDENDSGLDTVYEPEKTVDLKANYIGKSSRAPVKIKWNRVMRGADGYVDLAAHFAPHSTQIMSYLYREIESPVDQDATIALGTDDGSKLWLNGEKVYETRAHDAAVPEKARVGVKLKKGKNALLLKIVNGNNPHGFYLTILSEQELKAGK